MSLWWFMVSSAYTDIFRKKMSLKKNPNYSYMFLMKYNGTTSCHVTHTNQVKLGFTDKQT